MCKTDSVKLNVDSVDVLYPVLWPYEQEVNLQNVLSELYMYGSWRDVNTKTLSAYADYLREHANDLCVAPLASHAVFPVHLTADGLTNIPTAQDTCTVLGHAPAIFTPAITDFHVNANPHGRPLNYIKFMRRVFFNNCLPTTLLRTANYVFNAASTPERTLRAIQNVLDLVCDFESLDYAKFKGV